jgi:hypothetical protein
MSDFKKYEVPVILMTALSLFASVITTYDTFTNYDNVKLTCTPETDALRSLVYRKYITMTLLSFFLMILGALMIMFVEDQLLLLGLSFCMAGLIGLIYVTGQYVGKFTSKTRMIFSWSIFAVMAIICFVWNVQRKYGYDQA